MKLTKVEMNNPIFKHFVQNIAYFIVVNMMCYCNGKYSKRRKLFSREREVFKICSIRLRGYFIIKILNWCDICLMYFIKTIELYSPLIRENRSIIRLTLWSQFVSWTDERYTNRKNVSVIGRYNFVHVYAFGKTIEISKRTSQVVHRN